MIRVYRLKYKWNLKNRHKKRKLYLKSINQNLKYLDKTQDILRKQVYKHIGSLHSIFYYKKKNK